MIAAIFYVVKGGIPWRHLPADLPPWQTVYGVFRRWKHDHLWVALNGALRILVRKGHGKRRQPTAAILDSQSVKSADPGGEVGDDAGKRLKGRKRHLAVDTLGLVFGGVVTPADPAERAGAAPPDAADALADVAPQQSGQVMAGLVAQVAPLHAEVILTGGAQQHEASRHAVQAASVIFYWGGSTSARFSLVLWLIQRPPPRRLTTEAIFLENDRKKTGVLSTK